MGTVRVRIDGHVQGVGFRAWTEHEARALHLTGWVRNRRDGWVEAVFQGSADAVGAMIERCATGPPGARVISVRILDETDGAFTRFEVRASV